MELKSTRFGNFFDEAIVVSSRLTLDRVTASSGFGFLLLVLWTYDGCAQDRLGAKILRALPLRDEVEYGGEGG